MKYNLESSMSDRINFDQMQEQYAHDLLASMSFNLAMQQDPAEFAEIGWEAFLIDIENGFVDVDDQAEAKARFYASFKQGVIDWQAAAREI